ncbi:hypothetical protein IKN40_00270 [bacterium]|nr:hypothetical protein [bacterium]
MQLDKAIINTLARKREVPYEVMFKLSDAQQDQTKLNRYWFEFPSQWANQLDKDPIIGIRDMYLTKTNRSIDFNFTIQVVDSLHSSLIWIQKTYRVRFWLIGDYEFDYVTTTFNERLKNNDFTVTTENDETYSSINYDWSNVYKHFTSLYIYEQDDHKVYLRFQKKSSCPETVTVTDSSNETHTAVLKMIVKANNNDTKAIFGSNEAFEENDNIILIPVWTRYNCYVLSSLAADDVNNFLGHTKASSYEPLKYYRLSNKNKKFWIELYETRYHDVPVSLPVEKISNPNYDPNEQENSTNKQYIDVMRDDLFIEAIVAFTSSGML